MVLFRPVRSCGLPRIDVKRDIFIHQKDIFERQEPRDKACGRGGRRIFVLLVLFRSVRFCGNTLPRTAILQHTATHCITLQHTASHYNLVLFRPVRFCGLRQMEMIKETNEQEGFRRCQKRRKSGKGCHASGALVRALALSLFRFLAYSHLLDVKRDDSAGRNAKGLR